MMIGTELVQPRPRGDRQPGDVRFEVSDLFLASSAPFGIDLNGVSFTLRAGEILGVAGVAGNGQIELQEALSGEATVADPAAIKIDGHPIGRAGPTARRRHGLAFLPEERLGHGAVPAMTLTENGLFSGFGPKKLLAAGGVIKRRRDRELCQDRD